MIYSRNWFVGALVACTVVFSAAVAPAPAQAQSVGKAALSQEVSSEKGLSKQIKQYYAARKYKPIWVGSKNKRRTNALFDAIAQSGEHGLPTSRYRLGDLRAAFKTAKRGESAAKAEILATQMFLSYARDLSSGVLEPIKVDREIAIKPPRRAEVALLDAMSKSTGPKFLKALAPRHPEYAKLLKEKARLERLLGQVGAVGLVPVSTMRVGSSNKNVVKLRARLSAKGYGRLGNSPAYDGQLVEVVKKFQKDNGLSADGVAGPGTLKVLNTGPESRLRQILVNLERERWMNRDRGSRHIVVNLADFKFNVYDNNRITFSSDTVIGKVSKDRTPEFHDQMTHMVVNPTWHVPRSITGKEYLPILRKDPGFLARRNMKLVSNSGRTVNPSSVNFSAYNEKNFPYYIKQRPSKGNALGLVKFMFPNKYNIYLHDTPSKSLFKREVRAFSHGCVRVAKPFDFAYKLLEKQTSDPQGAFKAWLNTGREQYVNLEQPVPIYLNYRTAFFDGSDTISYRRDIYGRDRTIFIALAKAGVVLQSVQG